MYGSPDFWFKPGNPWRFKKGQSGNPGGRPKLLSDAYREWLAAENEDGVTNAAALASRLGEAAISFADVPAAKELRAATEGERVRTWEDDVADLLRDGRATLEDVTNEFGKEAAARIAARAGLSGSESTSVHQSPPTNATDNNPSDPTPAAQ